MHSIRYNRYSRQRRDRTQFLRDQSKSLTIDLFQLRWNCRKRRYNPELLGRFKMTLLGKGYLNLGKIKWGLSFPELSLQPLGKGTRGRFKNKKE